ncbi:MAG TPA: hypothetical protein VJ824_03390 [Bacillota bacterium]|nr:hypothetical protein [Bacillota bacterium]
MRYDQGYYQYQQIGLGISDYGYPEFPAYIEEEEVEDHEFGYHPFPAYCIDEIVHH